MKVYNVEKTEELTDYNLEQGYLKEDKLFVAHHEATAEVQEQSHVEVIAEYANGGKDIKTVVDVPYQAAREAYDEYENINIFVPYTAEELVKIKEQRYKSSIIAKIRRQYSLDDELSIHRQRDTKPDEWINYNDYCEACKAEVKAELGI